MKGVAESAKMEVSMVVSGSRSAPSVLANNPFQQMQKAESIAKRGGFQELGLVKRL